MAQDDKTSDLVDQIAADEARRAAAAHRPAGPSFLGRPAVAVASLALFAASGLWAYRVMKEPIPPPTLSHEQRVQSARFELVSARAAVEAYREQRGDYPAELGVVLDRVRSSYIGYERTEAGYLLATAADGEVVWLSQEDDASRFLQDGSHLPLPQPSPQASPQG